MNIDNSKSKTKKLKYVRVYDQLYEMLENGVYQPGSQLPGETELAEKMKVSRMTLRKALDLLQEDGIISSRSGIGHFVNESHEHQCNEGMEKIGSPLKKCCALALDELEVDFRIEPPSDYMCDVLKRKSPVVIIANRYYKSQGNTVAYALSFVPIEVAGQRKIDLNSTGSLSDFLDQDIYDICQDGDYKFTHSKTGNFTSENYRLSEDDSFILFQETLYDGNKEVLAVSKYYIPVDNFLMEFHLHC